MKPYLLSGNAGELLGFWAACCQAFLSYSGVELIGIAAGETERPRENLPKIVRHVSVRIVVYYVGAVLALGLTVSSNDPILRLIVTNGDYRHSCFSKHFQWSRCHRMYFSGKRKFVCYCCTLQYKTDDRAELCMLLPEKGKLLLFSLGSRRDSMPRSGVSESQLCPPSSPIFHWEKLRPYGPSASKLIVRH
jgi:Amino acid permease